jgi:hypothetical protein
MRLSHKDIPKAALGIVWLAFESKATFLLFLALTGGRV